jgi:ABC-type transport system substrate-binding protein
MKRWLLPLATLLALILSVSGCQEQQITPEQEEKASLLPTSSLPTEKKPVYGGTLRFITSAGPQCLGYPPEMSVTDSMAIFPAVDRLIDYSDDRDVGPGWEPVLAESVDDDIADNRIVFHLRPGVQFHDGSYLDADVVIWNYERAFSAKKLSYSNYWKGIKELDEMTVEITYTEYNNRLLDWGFLQIHSKAAWERASAEDMDKGIEWARTHVVGTGLFMLAEYVRDDHLIWVKNPDYWISGRPYLDAIEVRFMPDVFTAKALMLSGQADYWFGASVEAQKELVGQGFIGERGWFGLPFSIWPNTADPKSKWNDIRLRQAIEHALDKVVIAETFGSDYFTPLTTIAPPGEWGYDPDYPARHYDPNKAGQLLRDAGYSEGLLAQLLVANDAESMDIGMAIKQQLDAVGFEIMLDVADPGRFWGMVFGPVPGPDLVFTWSGTGITGYSSYMNNISTYANIRYSYLGHPPGQKALDDEAIKIPDVASREAMTQRLVQFVADNVMVIPVYWAKGAVITTPYVHPVQVSNGGFRWHSEEVWMEEH